jgi:transcriptional regulator with XRE-family HTH domain
MPPKIEKSLSEPVNLFSSPEPLNEKTDGCSLGEAIQLFRKEKGLSQEELAKKAGLDRSTIGRVECGILKSLSVDKLEVIAKAIGTNLKSLLLRANTADTPASCRSHLSRIEFALEYPEAGFRIVSHVPKRKEFFFGKIEIEPKKTIPSSKLPHPEQIYLHTLEGKILLNQDGKELYLKPGDCFSFPGFSEYEIYNPEHLKSASALFVTYPCFTL